MAHLPQSVPSSDQTVLNDTIHCLHASGLARVQFVQGVLDKTPRGLQAFISDTYLAEIFGLSYIVRRSKAAITHLIVEGRSKPETGATAFYCADVGGRLVTAAHNVKGRKILRIEDQSGKVHHSGSAEISQIIDDLDLAIIEVAAPPNLDCLSVEWDQEAIDSPMGLHVFGYPQIPQQSIPALICRTGELAGVGQDFYRRTSYIVSAVTTLGFSGGPAINAKGLVIGVVAGDPQNLESADSENRNNPAASNSETTNETTYDSEYSILTPAWYIRDIS